MRMQRTVRLVGPISVDRYTAGREFSELRGVSAMRAADKADTVAHPLKRELIWYLQDRSIQEGGFREVAEKVLQMFSERLGTKTMHRLGVRAGKIISGRDVAKIRAELDPSDWESLSDQEPEPMKGEELIALCRRIAIEGYGDNSESPPLEDFLLDLCINVRVRIALPGEDSVVTGAEPQLSGRRFPEVRQQDLQSGALSYFRDIMGAVFEYKRRHEESVREGFYFTALGRKIWATLDHARAAKGMVLLIGKEGRGKSEAAESYCRAHSGLARFVRLRGITNKTSAFRAICRALGIPTRAAGSVPTMQGRIEDVLERSRLMLVLDEAHFCFSQSRRMQSRPEMIDWIDTALCNGGLPAALISTPQFMVSMTRAADLVHWNYQQFRRRVKRYVALPQNNTLKDIEGVAKHVFSKASRDTIELVVGYASLSKRDLSAIGDVVAELRTLLGNDDVSGATFEQVEQVINDELIPSDAAFSEAIAGARKNDRRGRKAWLDVPVPAPEASPERAETEEREIPPRFLSAVSGGRRPHYEEPSPALVEAQS